MLQVVQHQRTGEVKVIEVPPPRCPDGGILVKNYFSLISAGTEKSSVQAGKSSLLVRAKKQPEQIRTVFNTLKREGLASTIRRVLTKLDSYKTFGYSCAGVVVETKSELFSVGDRVACGGAGKATHCEFVAIPQNLAVKVPISVPLDSAAFTTVGSIALQGIRQANPKLGEYVAVIGLGLIGLLTIQLLRANGCIVAGLDIRSDNFDFAKAFGCHWVGLSTSESIPTLLAFTEQRGFDSVIITASASSNEPLKLALEIVRKKGKIVLVGDIPIEIPRSPFYEKELEFAISCSYGPGRYDYSYEELGIDYPFAYVRWTENRNMRAFLELIANSQIDPKPLITHTFPIEQADKAYDLLFKPDAKPIGILIKYDVEKKISISSVQLKDSTKKADKPKIAFIGAGSFAQNYLIPILKKQDVELYEVVTQNPVNSISVGKHFGFKFASTNPYEVISKEEVDYLFVATRHNTHSEFVLKAIKNNKPIFVEKPLTISLSDLFEIRSKWEGNPIPIMVGYNRRFSKAFSMIKKEIANRKSPLAMHYRVNAGFIPSNSWIQDPAVGGGRILGEVCHFVDTLVFLTDSNPTSVFAETISHNFDHITLTDNVAITIKFNDGSVGVIEYFSNGDTSAGKEFFECFFENKTIILNNFELLSIYSNKHRKTQKLDGQKGHYEEIMATLQAFKEWRSPISFDQIYFVSLTTFAILESLRLGKKINLDEIC